MADKHLQAVSRSNKYMYVSHKGWGTFFSFYLIL